MASRSEQALQCPGQPWWRSTLALASASGLLLWASFPPLDWWPLAWLAPLFWLALIRRPRLAGRWPYAAIWLAGFAHWLLMLQGIRLANPALYLGWFALSGYLAVYLVLFVGLTRFAVHRWGVSIVLAAPAVWTGLELARGYALTGFSMALLAHTQIHWNLLIQIADLCGAYGVSFTIMAVAACLARTVPDAASSQPRRWTIWPLGVAALVLAAVLGYGLVPRAADRPAATDIRLRVALIQSSFDTIFEANPDRDREVFARYLELSRQAIEQHPDVDLVVWPESVFTGTLGDVVWEGPLQPPADFPRSPEEFREIVLSWKEAFAGKARYAAETVNGPTRQGRQTPGISLIVGTDTQEFRGAQTARYNSALVISPTGEITARYFKMHRVVFGEYIPFGQNLPWLYRLTPMPSGLTPGPGPKAFSVPPATLAPGICFESTVPHLTRRQVVQLQHEGDPPGCLINVTNDGWFWGSSILDFHLACAVFRSVENRLPMLVAANTGLSAGIDARGRVVARGPRRDEAILRVEVAAQPAQTLYQRGGDLFALICLVFCAAVGVVSTAGRWIGPKTAKRPE